MRKDTFKPRDILNKEVAGICGVARMTDKARALHTGRIGTYKYGVKSEQDTFILEFLDISADEFMDVAVRIPNDTRFGVWILDNCGLKERDIRTFNSELSIKWNRIRPNQNNYRQRRRDLLGDEPPAWILLFSPILWVFMKIFRK